MKQGFRIADRTYSRRNSLIIAELGTSHKADPARAKEMVCAAKESGADCVKVQVVYAREILHPDTGVVPLPGGDTRLYDVFKTLEADSGFYAALKEYADSQGVLFLATPFGPQSARILRDLEPALVKIASPELNYTNLLRECASWRIPMLLSAGVSKLGDIEAALEIAGSGERCLLHCVTAYPAPADDYNLSLLPLLGGIFGVCVGVSDHSLETDLVPVLAVSQGACVIEKHFCLSRYPDGLDDPIALPPAAFAEMCRAVRSVEMLDGTEILSLVGKKHSQGLVSAVLGDGVKRLAPSEAENYTRTNRSIHALRDIGEGEPLNEHNIAVLRTEKKLRPGLPPAMYEEILGRNARRDIPSGEGVLFDDV